MLDIYDFRDEAFSDFIKVEQPAGLVSLAARRGRVAARAGIVAA
jgi:hypothetical protein